MKSFCIETLISVTVLCLYKFNFISRITTYSRLSCTNMVEKRRLDQPNLTRKRPNTEIQSTLYIHNLNDKVNRKLLKHTLLLLFSTYGDVIDINMKMRGQAHVVYGSVPSAAAALRDLKGTEIFNKVVKIEYSRSKTKSVEEAQRQLDEE